MNNWERAGLAGVGIGVFGLGFASISHSFEGMGVMAFIAIMSLVLVIVGVARSLEDRMKQTLAHSRLDQKLKMNDLEQRMLERVHSGEKKIVSGVGAVLKSGGKVDLSNE